MGVLAEHGRAGNPRLTRRLVRLAIALTEDTSTTQAQITTMAEPTQPPRPCPVFGEFEPDATYVLRPGGYAVVRRDRDEVAVIRTHRGHSLPGGGVDPNESAAAAAVREAYEECRLRIAIRGELGTADQLTYSPPERTHFRKRCTFFLAELDGDQPQAAGEHDWRWLPLAEAARRMRDESQRWALELAADATRQRERKRAD